jgi:hypothetical protein
MFVHKILIFMHCVKTILLHLSDGNYLTENILCDTAKGLGWVKAVSYHSQYESDLNKICANHFS